MHVCVEWDSVKALAVVELLEEKSRTHLHWRTKEHFKLRLFSQSDSRKNEIYHQLLHRQLVECSSLGFTMMGTCPSLVSVNVASLWRSIDKNAVIVEVVSAMRNLMNH